MSNKKEKARRRADIAQKNRQQWLRWGLILGAIVLVIGIGLFRQSGGEVAEQSGEVRSHTPAAADQLLGQWLRTDGDYLIDITSADANSLAAGYYNPYPVNVEEAGRTSDADVFLKLVDTNYPGSTYTLNYSDEQDALVGIYFHAGQQEQFEVVFTRME